MSRLSHRFVAVKADGTITGWGDEEQGGGNGVLTEGSFGTAAPSDGGYTKFYSINLDIATIRGCTHGYTYTYTIRITIIRI
jgi:hypothetical protein